MISFKCCIRFEKDSVVYNLESLTCLNVLLKCTSKSMNKYLKMEEFQNHSISNNFLISDVIKNAENEFEC